LLSLASNDLSSLERYIQEIAGFFVIEATVISTTHDFRSKSSVETLWQTCTGKMNAHLFEALTACTNPDLYLKIKLLVNSFISTLEIYGYAVTSLTDLMYSLLDRYAELMKTTSYNAILKIIDEQDDYASLVVRDEEELEDVSASLKIPEEILKQNVSKRDGSMIFPKTLPFSAGVPNICRYIHLMITGFYRFADGFSQQNHEIDDLLKKTLENLLVGINNAYNEKIVVAGVSVVNQIMNNVSMFDHACHQFEDILMDKRFKLY
jgi:exocyst complex component 6